MDKISGCVFKAPARETDVELTVKRSRFIASLRIVLSAQSANALIKTFPALYPKANHHCWAYRIVSGGPSEHCSDDGEPSGTAGRPILGVLKRHSLDNTLLVVTRYFGGVKLGVRGLIEAYGEAAEAAARSSGTIEMELCNRLELVCGYDYAKTLAAMLKKRGFSEERQNVKYGEKVETALEIPCGERGEINTMLEEMKTRGLLMKLSWSDEVLARPRQARTHDGERSG